MSEVTDIRNHISQLEVCLDQVEYMTPMPSLSELPPRLDAYVTMRAEGREVDEKGIKAKPLHAKACAVLREAAIIGELPRGRVAELTGLSERRARSLLASLLEEGCSPRPPTSTVRLGFPPHAAGYWFPNLFPMTA